MILFALEEFAARRRKAQEELEALLLAVVEEGFTDDPHYWEPTLETVWDLYLKTYAEESGEDEIPALPRKFIRQVRKTLEKTEEGDERTPERIALWLATAILSQATVDAALVDEEELFLEWVDMRDGDVRPAHKEAHGQQRPVGEKFDVGGFEMAYPGDPSAPIELWINCRCTLRPTLASEALVAAVEHTALSVIVALPAETDPAHGIGEEQKHVTLAFLGEFDGDVEAVRAGVARVAAELPGGFTANVSGMAHLGPDKAQVWLVEAQEIADVRNMLFEFSPEIADAVNAADTHPHFVPHVTIGYDEAAPTEAADVSSIMFDRLALWHGEDQTEFALGGAVEPETETEKPDPFAKAKAIVAAAEEPVETEEKVAEETRVPWHGVLAPEGIASGDGRKFAVGSLRFRPLPLPLTWQKISDDGHKGNITVATIETIKRVNGEMRGSGFMRTTAEADEVVGLLADFGRFGVSIDADDSSFEVDEDEEEVIFTDARISSACIVPIPAFAEAWVALGAAPEGFLDGDEVVQDGEEVDEAEALVASVGVVEADMFVDIAPGRTEDGPGWITHPVDTDRLRDYWVSGPGAAKIAWGTPGDFNRCRVNTAEYVKPQYLNGYCANRHFDALGFWPGQHSVDTVAFAKDTLGLTDTDAAEALGLTAAAVVPAPADWFKDPEFSLDDDRLVEQKDGSYACPITVTNDGQVYGHLAAWGTCHIGYPDTCVAPPKSASSYAYFLTGEACLDDGTRAAVGNITIGGGHAGGRLGLRPTLAHYDSTSTVAADVACGDDEYGIWLAGRIRPGTSGEMIAALQASALSGDWRRVAGEMELVAALAVNVPGFPVPRTQIAASAEGQLSLVASGVVQQAVPAVEEKFGMVQMEEFAEAVAAAIESRRERRERMVALAAQVNTTQK